MTDKYIVEKRSARDAYIHKTADISGSLVYEQVARGHDVDSISELVKLANLGLQLESNTQDSEGDAQSDADNEDSPEDGFEPDASGFEVGSPEWIGAAAAERIQNGLDFLARFAAGAESVVNVYVSPVVEKDSTPGAD